MADLRAEVVKEGAGDAAWAEAVARDWRAAVGDPLDRALCAFAEKLTLAPAGMAREDVEGLRTLGLDDVAIHEAIQVVAYFNYINRLADAVHVDPEPEMGPYPPEPGDPAAGGGRPQE